MTYLNRTAQIEAQGSALDLKAQVFSGLRALAFAAFVLMGYTHQTEMWHGLSLALPMVLAVAKVVCTILGVLLASLVLIASPPFFAHVGIGVLKTARNLARLIRAISTFF